LKILRTPIEGLLLIEPKVFGDSRGYFFEGYRKSALAELGFHSDFIQENESKSAANVVRGLHLQSPPFAQSKLIRVVAGAIFDVALDVRTSSPTYGKWYGMELSEENKLSMLVPEGFAHGFCSLSENTVVQYRCSAYYAPESELGVQWNDPTLGIRWPVQNPLVSERDKKWPSLADFRSPF
jgi:dTDP-4-dehydrorhamnose 3,5-epimerase